MAGLGLAETRLDLSGVTQKRVTLPQRAQCCIDIRIHHILMHMNIDFTPKTCTDVTSFPQPGIEKEKAWKGSVWMEM